MLSVTAFFAAVLTFGYIFLSILVIRKRRTLKQSVGDGGDRDLLRVMRAHGNFAEYVPLGLVLMAILEINKIFSPLIGLYGVLLVIGRILHAYGLLSQELQTPPKHSCRIAGMMLTFTTLTLLAVSALISI